MTETAPTFYVDDAEAESMRAETVVTREDYEVVMERRASMTAIPISSALFQVLSDG